MEDIILIQNIERYLENKMTPGEKIDFEKMLSSHSEIDQLLVEHSMLLHHLDDYGQINRFKSQLQKAHNNLVANGDIEEALPAVTTKGKIIHLYKKYKKVVAIAAIVGGVIAFGVSLIVNLTKPNNENLLQQLNRVDMDVARLKKQQSQSDNTSEKKFPVNAVLTSVGSGFLIDTKGYLVTNAHVLKGSDFAYISNSRGNAFLAKVLCKDENLDLAILKIDDKDFKGFEKIPYSIRKKNVELGDEIFTLGFPSNNVTYNKGDVSAKFGFNSDSASLQVELNANPGNSGGPIFDKNGDIIGILSTREKQAQGVAFAIKSQNIAKLINTWKETDTTAKDIKIKLPATSSLTGLNRTEQTKKIEKYIFMIQAYNKR